MSALNFLVMFRSRKDFWTKQKIAKNTHDPAGGECFPSAIMAQVKAFG